MFIEDDWKRAAAFHGHICIGLTIGYRVAHRALAALREKRAPDEEIIAIVENDACGVDAIQWLLGCTLGKGNLIFRDQGKHAFTIFRRDTGELLRQVIGCSYDSGDIDITAHRIVVQSGQFKALDVLEIGL